MSDSKHPTSHVPTEFSRIKLETRSLNNKVFKKPATDWKTTHIPSKNDNESSKN